jgi:hypothetical protein
MKSSFVKANTSERSPREVPREVTALYVPEVVVHVFFLVLNENHIEEVAGPGCRGEQVVQHSVTSLQPLRWKKKSNDYAEPFVTS